MHVCIDDDKFHLSILQGTDNLKLSHHVRDNRNKLTYHVMATSRLGLKLATEYEKSNNNAVSITKNLIKKPFLEMALVWASPMQFCIWIENVSVGI